MSVDLKTVAQQMAGEGAKTVVFSGAGMSTDSGLPDFRSKDGLWQNVDPMELATTHAMKSDYPRFHEFYSFRMEQMKSALPNTGHRILAEWEAAGILNCIITQNVDNLHAAAGSKNIHELHGSVDAVRCCDCSLPSTVEAFIESAPCKACGGKLRPGVVLFGEDLPRDAMDSSWDASEEADVFIVLGSSLNVSPANQMPVLAKRAGGLLVICNRDRTHMDSLADYRTHDGISEFLSQLDALIKEYKIN